MNIASVSQNWEKYRPEDHITWATLMKKQEKLRDGKISKEYLKGLRDLQLDASKIVKIEELSRRLETISGWTLVPVTGLIPTRDFFYMLINKKYPVTVYIRRPHEIEFSEQPDIFHDVCGHLPLLTNEKFVQFLTKYSIIALKYVNNDRAIDFLGRLYWYTYEMGIIREDGVNKPYGGAIITSAEEIVNIGRQEIPKYAFELGKIFSTPYNPYKLQNEYFIIDSFDDLFESLENLESKLIEYLLLPEPDLVLRNYTLNYQLEKGFGNVIGFLNDTQFKYPDAISFVAGQPDERYFDVENSVAEFQTYVDHLEKTTGQSRRDLVNKIGQYNKTKGIVNDIVAEYLRKDENIHVRPDQVLMTVGAQEAFAIIVATLCNAEEDVILTEDPSYIGLSSFCKIFGYSTIGVRVDDEGVDFRDLRNRIIEVNRLGRKVKLLYVIPDYQNPSGSCMPIGSRLKLLELARQYNFLIIEDSVYNSFTYAQQRNPTLKSLDRYNKVIYVGSFSKSLFPGLRLGLIAADQLIENGRGENVPLIDEMVKVKAQLSNNTPTVNQAILGGILLKHNYSLHEWSKPKYESYKQKRNRMVDSLHKYIGAFKDSWAQDISWNEPDGGFFLKMSVPFVVDSASVMECAADYQVIFCPMRYFYLNGGGEKEIRLTFSNLSPERIEEGIRLFANYLRSRVPVAAESLVEESIPSLV